MGLWLIARGNHNCNVFTNSHAAERNGRYGSLVLRPTRRSTSNTPEKMDISSKLSIKTARHTFPPIQIPKKDNTIPSAAPAFPVAAARINKMAPGIHPFTISTHSTNVNPHLCTTVKPAKAPPNTSIQTGTLRLRISNVLAAKSQHPVNNDSAISILLPATAAARAITLLCI